MIYFVGAGPGAPDLITVRGARLLSDADVVIHAGSLVNPELLGLCKPECVIHDSASMTLEEIVQAMCIAESHGQMCVRLHTGDPSLFGAIAEQMDALKRQGVDFEVVPGVSSLFGATAALKAQLTRPGITQSVVLTRAEGRTPVPDRERLRTFAAHGCTVALFLSAGLLEDVQEELLAGGFSPSTPAAIVSRATWPDEATYRCTVGSLASCGQEHAVSKTALIIVGDVLGEGGGRSRLYDGSFSHGYREASHEVGGDETCV